MHPPGSREWMVSRIGLYTLGLKYKMSIYWAIFLLEDKIKEMMSETTHTV